MTPYFEADGVVLYLGDCLEVMAGMAAGSVDAVITDPPYGIGFKYDQYNDTQDGYGEWLWNIIEQSESKCTHGAAVFIWQAMINCRHFSEWFPRDYRIFAACKNFVQFRPTAIQYAFDPVIFWFVGKSSITPIAGKRDFHIGNTARWVCEESDGHPCRRPIDTVEYIVSLTRANIILDPFTGSGTTAIAAIRDGRRFVGAEISERYCEIAARRIERELQQPRLFTEAAPAPKPEQAKMEID